MVREKDTWSHDFIGGEDDTGNIRYQVRSSEWVDAGKDPCGTGVILRSQNAG